MAKIRKKSKANLVNSEREMYALAASGASVYQILSEIRGVTFEQAQECVKRIAEDLKSSGPAHRVVMRNAIRETGQLALELISGFAKDESLPIQFRLKAAETLLKHAADMSDETVMRSWQERPADSGKLQPTIFDFGPVLEPGGEIGFRAETRLAIVPAEESDD